MTIVGYQDSKDCLTADYDAIRVSHAGLMVLLPAKGNWNTHNYTSYTIRLKNHKQSLFLPSFHIPTPDRHIFLQIPEELKERACLIVLSCVVIVSCYALVNKLKTCFSMQIIAASSLQGALYKFNVYNPQVTAIKGLTLNIVNAVDENKTVHHILEQQNIILWHDVINNSITKHYSNNNTAMKVEELMTELHNLPCRIVAIVYCQREGAEDIYATLRAQYFTIDAPFELFSRKKRQAPGHYAAFRKLHIKEELEFHMYSVVWNRLERGTLATLPQQAHRNQHYRKQKQRPFY